MALNDPKLKIEITADSRQAQRAVTGLYADVNKLGGGFTSAFGGFLPIAATAAAAVTGVATAAAGVGLALFTLTKEAADYGSAIFDATQKTGQSAEVISALKYAADESGSSLEAITGSIGKFTVLVGEARTGSEKASNTLKQYGITATTVDGALAQAIQTINNEKDATLQAAAAKALFKDRTGEILPVIKSFDGNLPALMDKLKKMGLLMSDEDARAADLFGDTLNDLEKQAGAVGRQFAMELMPYVTQAMRSISGAMTENQGVVAAWGKGVGEVLSGISNAYSGLAYAANVAFTSITGYFGTNLQATSTWVDAAIQLFAPYINVLRSLSSVTGGVQNAIIAGTTAASDRVKFAMPKFPNMGSAGVGKAGKAGGSGESEADKAAREAEERRRKAVQAAEKEMQQTLAIYSAGYKERTAALDQALETGQIVEVQHIRDSARVRQEAVMDEMTLLNKLAKNENLNDEDRQEIAQKLKVLAIELRVEKLKGSTEITAQIKKEVKAENELLEAERKRLDAIKKVRMQKKADADAARIEEMRRKRNRGGDSYDFGIGGSFKDFSDQVLSNGPKMSEVLGQLGQIGSAAFGQLAQGLGAMVESWVLLGDLGPNAMRKMVASVLAGVASQSAVLAIFELAKGFAALWLNPAEAASHFKAAALFGVVAVGAAVAGRAVAGDSFKTDSNKKSSSGGGNSSSSNDRNPDPFSRASATAYQSGQNLEIRKLSDEIAKLRSNISSMRPGDVLTAGARQKPGFFATQVHSDISGNSALGSRILRSSGVK